MVICPTCRKRFKAKDKVCPRCGWIVQEIYKSNCPFCGELIPRDSKECPRCGTDLTASLEKEKLLANPQLESPPEDLTSPAPPGHEAEAVQYTCPKCAAELEGTEPECPVCGQVLIGKLGLRCPICAATVGKRRKRCPSCGTDLGDITKTALPMVSTVRESRAPPLAPIETQEPGLGTQEPSALSPSEVTPQPEVEPAAEEPSEKAEPTVTEAAPEPQPETVAETERETAPEVAPEAPESPAEETAPLPQPETEPEGEPVKEREPPSEVVTVIDYSTKPSDRGLTNGVAHINGRGMVNGTGAVNGKAFVNGTGLSNGLGTKPTRRSRVPARWRFLSVLVAVVVVISAFAFISYPGNRGKYSVDGNFAEWNDATVYGTRVSASNPSLNISEWAVATQESDLFLYFMTQGRMMTSAEPETFYLFADADGTNSTGYTIDSIGAEYMLRVTGWQDSVNSSTLMRYSSSTDQLNWNAWTSSSSVDFSTDGQRLEARASIPSSVEGSARFVLISEDQSEDGSISYIAPLKGPLLIVEQLPSADVALDGLVSASSPVKMLELRFTSVGGSGRVERISPSAFGASVATQSPAFPLETGETMVVNVSLNTLNAAAGHLVSVEITAQGIVSSYTSVEIIGLGARAYVNSPPASIVIDGAFADWSGTLWEDTDSTPVTNPNVDINEVGNVSTSLSSFFYVSVKGEICEGAYVPATVVKPSGAGGGGAVVLKRQTAEDTLRIYVDSDRSNSTGERVTLGSKTIGADRLIEVKGLFGMITSTTEFEHSALAGWGKMMDAVTAANDARRMEIQVSASSLGGSSDIDFIVETTSWTDKGDHATFGSGSTKTWVVDPLSASPYATAMSYQRKLFYDGVNYWSFFFDGMNTVCKYSFDEGQTWTYAGRVFGTSGVNKTSIWYDSSTRTVYAVGDVDLATTSVLVQAGVVDAAAHRIKWASADSPLKTSTVAWGSKNTYISKDLNGYLWVLAGNLTQLKPLQHDLTAFHSSAVNSTSSWVFSGGILPYGEYESNSVGSIVPAGYGSDMWAVYTYEGYVSAKKYNGAWPQDYDEIVIYHQGTSWANTGNSPPSVVVDSKGVVHVVFGTGRANKDKVSIPQIEYSRSLTNTTFTAGVNLDPSNDTLLIANYWPTISLDSSTNNVYVIWLQCDSSFTPRTVMGRKCISGTWSSINTEPQTSFVKWYTTSIYSAPDGFKICWQWTQNSTMPIDVMYDSTWIPELGQLALPIMGFLAIFVAVRRGTRKGGKDDPSGPNDR